jgi:hypothetical protein
MDPKTLIFCRDIPTKVPNSEGQFCLARNRVRLNGRAGNDVRLAEWMHGFRTVSSKNELEKAIRTIIVRRGKTDFKAWFGGLACSGLAGYRTCRAWGNA